MLSPKAVIEHLQLMEREEILSFRLDERRRKYYYLANDINVMVSLQRQDNGGLAVAIADRQTMFRRSLMRLQYMVETRDELVHSLEHLDQHIDQQIREIIQGSNGILEGEDEVAVVIALAQGELSLSELNDMTGISTDEIGSALERLKKRGMVRREGSFYKISGVHAE
jgi:ArsR family transcriptional regulator